MRVTFPRLADHERGYSVIERDDGVVYHMAGPASGTELPHDLRHLIVERELRISDGIWGTIAAGTVYPSMTHVRGRQHPRAAERPALLKKTQRDRILVAEVLANLVAAVAALDDPSPAEIRRLTRMRLSAAPLTEPGSDPADVAACPPEALAAAASALQVEAARWARLRVGEEIVYDWRLPVPPAARAVLRAVPRQRDGVTCPSMGNELRTADRELMALALQQARASLNEGGVPVGAVLAAGGEAIAAGHNERVQYGDPVAHGEISALRNAGRRASYADTTLYTTLSPCQMCSGAILLFQIPRVVVGEARTFAGDLDFLRSKGVAVLLLDDQDCVAAMTEFQARYPQVWSEDIGGR